MKTTLAWKKNPDPDSEFNSYVAELQDSLGFVKLEVYSDRDGTRWSYLADNDEDHSDGDNYVSMLAAQLACEEAAKELADNG
jgi:hypothetical protein